MARGFLPWLLRNKKMSETGGLGGLLVRVLSLGAPVEGERFKDAINSQATCSRVSV